MTGRWQARYITSTWAGTVDEDCSCRWINYFGYGGWYLVERNDGCLIHGEPDVRLTDGPVVVTDTGDGYRGGPGIPRFGADPADTSEDPR